MRDGRIADVAIDRERVLGRQELVPVDGPHRVVEFVGRMDLGFQHGPQYANGGAKPQARAIEQSMIALEAHPTAPRLDRLRTEGGQFASQDRLQPARTGGEVGGHQNPTRVRSHASPAAPSCSVLRVRQESVSMAARQANWVCKSSFGYGTESFLMQIDPEPIQPPPRRVTLAMRLKRGMIGLGLGWIWCTIVSLFWIAALALGYGGLDEGLTYFKNEWWSPIAMAAYFGSVAASWVGGIVGPIFVGPTCSATWS